MWPDDEAEMARICGFFDRMDVADMIGWRLIQAEVTFGVIKWKKSYKRLFRRGEKSVNLNLK